MKYGQRSVSRYQGKRVGDVLLQIGVGLLLLSGLLYWLFPFHLKNFMAFPALGAGFILLFWLSYQLPTYTKLLMQRILWIVLAVAVVFFGLTTIVLLAGAHDDVEDVPQVMVVLGTRIEEDGTPTALLQDRLDAALGYYQDHPGIMVVVSGGQGSDEPTTEADAMAEYLVAEGVPESQILQEDSSSNTFENLGYSLALLEEEGYDSQEVLVVSNGFHLTRVRMLWERVAEEEQSLSTLAAPSSDLISTLQSYIREVPALVKSWVFDR